jgi:hypothetical protein
VAEAEIHFRGGEFDGVTSTGFAVWVDGAGTGET